VVVGSAPPTSVQAFASTPRSPTNARSLTFGLRFGGPVTGLSLGDIVRSGTATNCAVGAPIGAGSSWTITVTGCSQGTVLLGLKARSVSDAVGNLGPGTQATAAVVIDRTAPVATTPKATLRSGVSLASISLWTGLLATVGWGGTDSGGAGIGGWDVQRSLDGGAFTTIAAGLPTASLAMSLAPGHTYRFRVRARDRAGNVGAWVTGATTTPVLRQQTSTAITWKGSWATSAGTHYSGESARLATAAGASASYTFTGRSIAWVSTFAPDRGSAKVYVDGVLVATVSTYATTTSFRRVAFAKSWSTSGYHTLRIVVVGTAGHPRVDVDALEVLR
jgi:hypothetical protein